MPLRRVFPNVVRCSDKRGDRHAPGGAHAVRLRRRPACRKLNRETILLHQAAHHARCQCRDVQHRGTAAKPPLKRIGGQHEQSFRRAVAASRRRFDDAARPSSAACGGTLVFKLARCNHAWRRREDDASLGWRAPRKRLVPRNRGWDDAALSKLREFVDAPRATCRHARGCWWGARREPLVHPTGCPSRLVRRACGGQSQRVALR